MKTSTLLALAAASGAQLAAAHSTVWNIVVNGEKHADGKGSGGYIDAPPNDSPVIDVKSKNMACNVIDKKASKSVEVKGGDKIGIQWHYESEAADDMIIDPSHVGPVITYMAPAESGASGKGWVKLAEQGWANGKWGVETLIKNKGIHDITVPDVPAGDYLLRPEIIALHEGFEGKPQFYMECIHIKVTSSGSTNLPEGVSIPGVYSAEDPGLHYNVYTGGDHSGYKVPGGEVWSGAGGSGSGSGSNSPKPAQSGSPKDTPTTLATVTKPAPTGSSENDDEPENGPEEEPETGNGNGNGNGETVKDWEQCGGEGWEGATKCRKGFSCKEENQWYFQCVQD